MRVAADAQLPSQPGLWPQRAFKAHLICLGAYTAFVVLIPPNVYALLLWLITLVTWAASTVLCLWSAVSHRQSRSLTVKSALIAPTALYALSLIGSVLPPPLVPSPLGEVLLLLLLLGYPGWRILNWFGENFNTYDSTTNLPVELPPTARPDPNPLLRVTAIALCVMCPIACLALYFVFVFIASLNETLLPGAGRIAGLLPILQWVGVPAAMIATPYAILGLIRGVQRRAMAVLLGSSLITLLSIAGSLVAIGALAVSSNS